MTRSPRGLLALVVGCALAVPAGLALGSSPASAARPTCHGLGATIVGGPRNDRIVGTPGRDVIVGLGGNDTIKGRGGDDVICGGDGADRILGGSGRDRLYGDRAELESDRGGVYLVPNVLDGGPGDDLLDPGRDARSVSDETQAVTGVLRWRGVSTGVSVDVGTGSRGTAVLGAQRDRIVVRGRMEIVGTPYADTVVGSGRAETILAGAGADTISAGGGRDQITTDPPGGDPVGSVDTVDGGSGDDSIDSAGGADTVHGGPGDDALRSTSGTGRLYGDVGDDDLSLSIGASARGYVIDGGTGRDRGATDAALPTDAGTALTVRTVDQTIAVGDVVTGTIAGLEETWLGDDLQWTFYGSDAPDDVVGGFDYPFRAFTYGGDDVVQGTSRDDLIDVGDGTDKVKGEEGVDTCLDAEVVRSCERLTP